MVGQGPKVETIATFLAGIIVLLVLTTGIGNADCISQCIGNTDVMHCTTCDSPKDGQSWISPID